MSWNKIWDEPVTYALAGKGNFVFAVHENTGDIYSWNPPGSDDFLKGYPWPKIGGPGAEFVIAEHTFLVGLAPDKSGVYLHRILPPEKPTDPNQHKWVQIGGPAANIYGGGDGLLAINPTTKDVYQYQASLTAAGWGWKKIGGPGKMFAVGDSFAEFTVRIYGISPNGGVYMFEGKYNNDVPIWTSLGGPSGKIYAGATLLYGTEPGPEPGTEKDIYLWQQGKTWSVIREGVFKGCAVDANGDLFTHDDDGVWRYDGFQWAPIGGPAVGIYAGGTANLVATSPVKNTLWRYTA